MSERSSGSPIKKWAQRIALGAAIAGGGFEVGNEHGKATMVQPEKKHVEKDAEELADQLQNMIDLADELDTPGIIINKDDKYRELHKDCIVEFSRALGFTPDLQSDPSARVTWPKSSKAEKIYKLIGKIIERSDRWGYQIDHTLLHNRAAELMKASLVEAQK